MSQPSGVAFGPDGHLYVSSHGGHSILRFHGDTGAFIDAFIPPHGGGLLFPIKLAFTSPTPDAHIEIFDSD